MKRRQTLIGCAVAAALAVPFTAGAQNTTLHQYPQASGNASQVAPENARFPGPARDEKQAQQDHPDLMVITIEPVAPPMTYRQRAESTFRALDRDSDGEISMAEAGVNTQLLNAFQKLDRNSNRSIVSCNATNSGNGWPRLCSCARHSRSRNIRSSGVRPGSSAKSSARLANA